MTNNPIVDWIMQSMRDISQMPIKGIALVAITTTGESYTNYHNVKMNDKLLIAGLINQDATFDALAANGVIDYAEDLEEEKDNNQEEEENDD